MKRIFQLKIQNFKAFQQEQGFELKGKNILVYGNNGSGKSSLFWALYTLTQSSIKNDAEIQKYFKPFVESDTASHQSLRNIFANNDENAFIELTTIDEHSIKKTYKISHNLINTNKDSDTTLQELNLASDFINYKLLHNFYTATHKQEINLWSVFERDIFPFLTDNANRGWLDKIRAKTKDVQRYPSGQVVRGTKKIVVEQEISDINNEIEALLVQIQNNANDFIKQHFFANKEAIRLSLTFTKKFSFDKVKNQLWQESKQSERHRQLHIKLVIELFQEDTQTWQALHRAQSFLNESLLTRIAISIRIGALRTRVQSTDFKILVLDDMLISLDMSNRMPLIKMILNQGNEPDLHFFDAFQKIILTHDKGFYELIKRQTSPDEWEYFNFHAQENASSAPRIKKDQDALEKAQAFLREGEYEACGAQLRKETEALINKYLQDLNGIAKDGKFESLNQKLNEVFKPVSEDSRKNFNKLFVNKALGVDLIKKLPTHFSLDEALSPAEKGQLTTLTTQLFAYLIKQYERKENKEKILNDIQGTLQRIMNPASHASLTPLYESELTNAIDGVKKLKEYLDHPSSSD